MAAKDILIRLRANGEAFSADVKTALSGMESEVARQGESSGRRLGERLRTGLAASTAGIAAAAAGIATAVNQSFDLALDLSSTSKQLGIGVEALQEYRNAARLTGVDLGALDDSIAELTKRVGEAATGNRDAQAAFAALGVSFQTASGHGVATEAVLRDVIERLNAIDDPARRAALGAQLLGDEYQKIEPLVRAGSAGIDQMTASLREQNGVLTADQVELLRQANAEYDRLQTILSVNIAGTVAANADGIRNLAGQIAWLTGEAIRGAAALGNFLQLLGSGNAIRIRRTDEVPASIRPRAGVPGWWNIRLRRRTDADRGIETDPATGSPLLNGRSHSEFLSTYGRTAAPGIPPSVAPVTRRGGGGGGGGDAARAAREAERAAERRAQIIERETEFIQQQLGALTDAARVEDMRATRSEGAAEIERARAEFLRSHAAAAATSADELARALDITGPLSADERTRLETMIDQLDVIERQTVEQEKQRLAGERTAEAARARKAAEEEAARASEEALRADQARAESMIEDLAGFYADLFSGSTGNIWDNFKRMGIAAISEVAARWTLARLSGQSFDLAGTLGGMAQRGGLLGGVLGGISGLGGVARSGALATQGAAGSASGGGAGFLGAAAPWALGALAAAQILPGLIGSLKTKKGSATLAIDSGLLTVGDVTGNSKSRKQAASGALGNVIDSLNSIAEQLGGSVTGAGSVSIGMRKKSWRVDTSGQGRTKKGAGVIDFGDDQEAAIRYAIGEALRDWVIGGISDASKRILASGKDLEEAIAKAVSIEQIPKLLKARLDPLGAAIDEIDAKYAKLAATLKEGGASAEQIAQARQLWQMERDDAVKNIGAASATLRDYLKSLIVGPDSPLSAKRQREQAEAAFNAYQGQLAGLDAGAAQIAALRASGASAEQIAAAEAEQRKRAAAFDQEKFAEAASLWLQTSRRTDASTEQFFAAYDRVKQITERAASLIEAAVPAASGKDPFAELTATAAQNTVAILDTQTGILNAINDNLAAILANGGGAGGGGFVTQPRRYA